jgi:hypothetical protein
LRTATLRRVRATKIDRARIGASTGKIEQLGG